MLGEHHYSQRNIFMYYRFLIYSPNFYLSLNIVYSRCVEDCHRENDIHIVWSVVTYIGQSIKNKIIGWMIFFLPNKKILFYIMELKSFLKI